MKKKGIPKRSEVQGLVAPIGIHQGKEVQIAAEGGRLRPPGLAGLLGIPDDLKAAGKGGGVGSATRTVHGVRVL